MVVCFKWRLSPQPHRAFSDPEVVLSPGSNSIGSEVVQSVIMPSTPGSSGGFKKRFLNSKKRPKMDLGQSVSCVPWMDSQRGENSNFREHFERDARVLSQDNWRPDIQGGYPLMRGLRTSMRATEMASHSSEGLGGSMFKSIPEVMDELSRMLPPHLNQQLQLPYLAVVGCQSGGKSSVLETIVGKDFLPRKNGLCTQRPLFIDLVRCDTAMDYAVFVEASGERVIEDFATVKAEIERLTELETNRTKKISPNPIHLRIHSRDVLSMRLVDLPGITKVAVDDQPESIEKDTTDLIVKYIQDENVVILAVIPANCDVETSDALKIAWKVDPKFDRTIGVLTKIDIMDKGTDVCGYLKGSEEPGLKLGYTGVINRNAEDTRNGVNLSEHLEKEEAWFRSNKSSVPYRGLENCGRKALLNKLNGVFVNELRKYMSHMREIVQRELSSVNSGLVQLERPFGLKAESKGEFFRQISKAYQVKVKRIIEGDEFGDENKESTPVVLRKSLEGFRRELRRVAENASVYTNEDLLRRIENSKGVGNPLLVIDKPLEQLVFRVVDKLETECLDLLGSVAQRLREISKQVIHEGTLELNGFPRLREKFQQVFEKVLNDRMKDTKLFILHRLQTEKEINTSHKNFIGVKNAWLKVKEKCQSEDGINPAGSQGSGMCEDVFDSSGYCFSEQENVDMLRILLESYCRDVVSDSLAHGIPNTILVGLVKDRLHHALEIEFQGCQFDESLLEEDPTRERQRSRYNDIIKSCTDALQFIHMNA